MLTASTFRLNWRKEFDRLVPYLGGKRGVVLIDYGSEEAAPLKFNHLLKELFYRPGNGRWLSLRVDREWFTTRQAAGALDEIDRLLKSAGFEPPLPAEQFPHVEIMKAQEAGGDITNNINGLEINFTSGFSGRIFRARAAAVFDAMRQYIAGGGRFMVILNDMPLAEQADFWHRIWHGGLSEVAGGNLLLVVHAGPASGRRAHHECPAPDLKISLPEGVEEESERDDDFFDDICDAFEKSGLPRDLARHPAEVHLENNRHSILQLNMKLSTAIMAALRNRTRTRR